MIHNEEAQIFLQGMRDRWEARARLDYRYFTESVNFHDPEAWDAQADHEVGLFLGGLDRRFLAGSSLLEIGCGPGRLLARMAPQVRTAVGVDISLTMLHHARENCIGQTNVALVLSGGADLAFLRDRVFRLVVMHAVAIHMPLELIRRTLLEGQRVTAPGGRFRFTLNRKPTDAGETDEVKRFVSSALQQIPPGSEELVQGLDYSGHRFRDDEIDSFLETFGFEGFRVEKSGLEVFGVDAWVSA